MNLDHGTAAVVDDMDIDIGTDLDPVEDLQIEQSESEQPGRTFALNPGIESSHVDATQVNKDNITPHKVHIRGLDDLTTEDIIAYVAYHSPGNMILRIEWIDDTSANIVLDTPAIALKVLHQLSDQELQDHSYDLQLRSAKPHPNRSESSLQIRLALTTDQKRPRAHEASRFYMMHPELDPRERRRRGRSKYHDGGDYHRLRYGRDEQRRRRRNDREEGFDATMYDDDADASATHGDRYSRRRPSLHSNYTSDGANSPRERRSRRGNNGSRARGRGRSASPDRSDGFGKRGRNLSVARNDGKELFPSKSTLETALTASEPSDLFPNKKIAGNIKKELFPSKLHGAHHRRSDAIDATDATADLFAHRLSFTKQAGAAARNAFGKPNENGRLRSDINEDSAIIDESVDDGISIRGASRQDLGFSIRGVASDGTRVGAVRELFPGKGGNAGKELFAEKLEGRGGRRNKAEDMFY